MSLDYDYQAVPYRNVPYEDQDANRPDVADRDIYREALAIRNKTLKDFEQYFKGLKRNHPEPDDIRLPGILQGMKDELSYRLEEYIERLNLTQHYPLKMKLAQLSEFQITALGTLQSIMQRWMQKYLWTAQSYQRDRHTVEEYVKEAMQPVLRFFDEVKRVVERSDGHETSDDVEVTTVGWA